MKATKDRTMQTKTIRDGSVEVAYTEKPLSGWGGQAAFFEYLDRIGMWGFANVALPDGRTSPNQVTPADIVRSLFATVLSGGTRFAHVDRIRQDEVIRCISGAARLPGADSIRRYFGGFRACQSEQMYSTLQAMSSPLLAAQAMEDTVDLDSTVVDRFGEQEGVAKGYHPTRAGRRSHHPLLAMLAQSKWIVHSWLRAGGASTHRGAIEFVDEMRARLPEQFKIRAVRGDAGFFSKEYLQAFEERGLPYVISMKLSKPVKRFCRAIPNDQWKPFDSDSEVADVMYHPAQWPHPRRVVVIRYDVTELDPMALFHVPAYEHRAFVTSLDLQAPKLVHFYNDRGDCENRIKEFKLEFGGRGFVLQSFHGTEAVFRLLCVLFNLVAEFKRLVVQDTKLTLSTLRTKIFVIGAHLGTSGRRKVLRLGLTGKWRTEFDKLIDRISALSISTAAHLNNYLISSAFQAPSPWRRRRKQPLFGVC
jgi:hypothetical protein